MRASAAASVVDAVVPEAAAVLELGPEHRFEEGGRHFVVLRVREVGDERDGAVAAGVEEGLARSARRLDAGRRQLA